MLMSNYLYRFTWKEIPATTAEGACMVNWDRYLFVFGGMWTRNMVQRYDILTGKHRLTNPEGIGCS